MAPRSGTGTREKLLDAAQAIVLNQGYAATSIDQIIEDVGMTKGSFFYHFKTKRDLARALIERFARQDERILLDNMGRAEKLSDDPLQQVLIFVGLIGEVAEQLDRQPEPGCLFATYCYESGVFEGEIKGIVSGAMLKWREVLGAKLRAAAEKYPPRVEVDIESLADMMTGVFEGAYVLSRSLDGPHVFVDQIRHYRNYLKLLFG